MDTNDHQFMQIKFTHMTYSQTLDEARAFGEANKLSIYKLDYVKVGLHRFKNILDYTDEQWDFTTKVVEACMVVQRALPVPVNLIGNDELFVRAMAKAKYHKENPFAIAEVDE